MDILRSIDVVNLAEHPEYLEAVLGWYMKEWPEAGSEQAVLQRLYGTGQSGKLPMGLVATSRSSPVGFLSLVFYEEGVEPGRVHWVDALFTHPSFRRRGIASLLLQIGERQAVALGIKDLYALTDEVSLYRRQGWSPAKETKLESSRDVVMHKKIGD